MPVPKTNLFKGDRVKLRPHAVKTAANMREGALKRVGTIDNDTLNPKENCVKVRWDGNQKAGVFDRYHPDDLALHEEEAVA